MSNPSHNYTKRNGKRVGRYPLSLLSPEQEFRTLLTGRLGYIESKDPLHVTVILEPGEQRVHLHPGVVVDAK